MQKAKMHAVDIIKKYYRGLQVRRKVQVMRQEEMQFLEIEKTIIPEDDPRSEAYKLKLNKLRRKYEQRRNHMEYEMRKEQLLDEIEEDEGSAVKDALLKDEHEWILKYFEHENEAKGDKKRIDKVKVPVPVDIWRFKEFTEE